MSSLPPIRIDKVAGANRLAVKDAERLLLHRVPVFASVVEEMGYELGHLPLLHQEPLILPQRLATSRQILGDCRDASHPRIEGSGQEIAAGPHRMQPFL